MTRKARRHDGNAYGRPCPFCGARAGQRCTRNGGAEAGEVHAARRAPAETEGEQLALEVPNANAPCGGGHP